MRDFLQRLFDRKIVRRIVSQDDLQRRRVISGEQAFDRPFDGGGFVRQISGDDRGRRGVRLLWLLRRIVATNIVWLSCIASASGSSM